MDDLGSLFKHGRFYEKPEACTRAVQQLESTQWLPAREGDCVGRKMKNEQFILQLGGERSQAVQSWVCNKPL